MIMKRNPSKRESERMDTNRNWEDNVTAGSDAKHCGLSHGTPAATRSWSRKERIVPKSLQECVPDNNLTSHDKLN